MSRPGLEGAMAEEEMNVGKALEMIASWRIRSRARWVEIHSTEEGFDEWASKQLAFAMAGIDPMPQGATS